MLVRGSRGAPTAGIEIVDSDERHHWRGSHWGLLGHRIDVGGEPPPTSLPASLRLLWVIQPVSFRRSPWMIRPATVGRPSDLSPPVDWHPCQFAAAYLATADRSLARQALGWDQSFLIHRAHSYFHLGFRSTFNFSSRMKRRSAA
jgi:hypothetical protein